MTQHTSRSSVPRFIDARKFAQQQGKIQGQLDLSSLPRILEVAQEKAGVVEVDLDFKIDDHGHSVVTGTIDTNFSVVCQRCLGPLPVSVSSDVNVAVTRDQADAKLLPRSLDPWIVEGESGDLHELIEEEILLELPMAPFHDYECVPDAMFSSGEEKQETKTTNPFSVLEQLKGSPKQ
ncbi:YceD family protein [Sessilibacter corallicola]|uniref:YceD family protein n=1 Tax=Sessilibacter corallicola TaxID=2904075 RepID=UPI001E4524F3|nr:YceD family protein [Sessilibacter corallicola]MCE2030223.1 YceD family protein [Sessilibacter corallicola]